METIYILGRQSAIGLAELESLFGSEHVTPIGSLAARVSGTTNPRPFSRIGGSLKACQQLATLPTSNWEEVQRHLLKEIAEHVIAMPEGKIKLGLSVYGRDVTPQKIQATSLAMKRTIKQAGRSIRVIPNKSPALNAAQVLRNKLTDELGVELNLIFQGTQTIVARTLAIQDIDAYAARDQARPKRDARVGMLPPKLAQTIVNMAVGHRPEEPRFTVVDPFCGTGVVLQESYVMGFSAYGSDIDPRMVDYSRKNVIDWLMPQFMRPGAIVNVSVGDATTHAWPADELDAIACETYLGRPFSALPLPAALQKVMQDVDTIHRKFLKNVTKQTSPGFRLCIAVPAWRTKYGFEHLKMLDSLDELGYNRVGFVHADNKDLIYHREDQVVGRELVVLMRK